MKKILFLFSSLLVFSRGIFEIYDQKYLGYLMGGVGISVASFCLIAKVGAKFLVLKGNGFILFFYIAYLLSVLVSMFFTSVFNNRFFYVGFLYSILHVFFLTMLIVIRGRGDEIKDFLFPTIAAVGLLILIGGGVELAGIIQFPGGAVFGDGMMRLSGVLGSKQHLGYVAAFIGGLLFWMYRSKETKNNNWSTLYICLSVCCYVLSVLSLTRNGIPMIIGPFIILMMRVENKESYRLIGISSILVLISWFGVSQFTDYFVAISDRLFTTLTAVAGVGSGNSTRLNAWLDGLNSFSNGMIIFGDQTGFFSQAGDRLGLVDTKHFESALIQQFGNFGLFGGIAFCGFFVCLIIEIDDIFLRGLAFFAFLNFVYYPGSEVFPIVFCWILLAGCTGANRGHRLSRDRSE